MKRVIDGKIYNTDTADQLHYWGNGCGSGDFNFLEERLYRTKKGAFFIAGEGGANSKYGRSCGSNSTCGGSEIRIIDKDIALKWLEAHDATDAIETHFANDIEEG